MNSPVFSRDLENENFDSNRANSNPIYEQFSLHVENPRTVVDYQYPLESINQTTLEMDEIPPPEYFSEPPPPYLKKSQYRESSFVHRLSETIVNIDLSTNCMLVFIMMVLYFSNSNSDSPTSFIIPFIYFVTSLFGRIAYKKKRAKAMFLISGAYFARWAGDMAVLIYVIVNDLHSYYNMSVFSTLITLPMLGIRGFYPDLFPCYNITDNDTYVCSTFWSNSSGMIDGTYVFGLILLPQLLACAIILYDSFHLMQIDEDDDRIARNQRGVR